ncbi:MAG: cation:proton antiporter [Planctomycetes bacterium]|nr:cation:proton antiporter [Planctomycetota bacterium]
MTYLIAGTGAEISGHAGLNLALLFGLIVLGGVLGSRLFQRFHIPQVVGCVVVGILLGRDVLGLITPGRIEDLRPFTMFALGIIGFMIGAELRAEVFKKYGRQFFIILLSQGFGAFVLVSIATSAVAWLVLPSVVPGLTPTGRLAMSIAIGLVLGAIASATAPASTVNVLWEYKTRGPLTAAILAIVALDDALALLLYRAAATGAKALLGTSERSVLLTTGVLLGEILGTVLLGFLAGVMLYFLLKFIRAEDKILEASIACLLLVVGICIVAEVDPILPAMVFGITMANLAPRQSKSVFELIKKFSPPIYISFFVLAGAHIELGRLAPPTLAITAAYISCRVGGKVLGAWLGARHCGAPAVVRKYLGMCLLPQAGVAIGLAILTGQMFSPEFGKIVIMVVMTETFIIELLGPILVKVGVKKAGEVGMNVTEEDLIKMYTVGDVMDAKPTSIPHDLSLHEILEVFSASDGVYYPVIDGESRIVGTITIGGIKEMFANQDVAAWLLACDVAEPVRDKTTSDAALEEVMEQMRRYHLENLPVVGGDNSDELVGVLDYSRTLRNISAEVLHRRKTADGLAAAAG